MEKYIILAFPGSGKSYLTKKYKNVTDNDFCYFKFVYDKPAYMMTDEELEQRKGNKEIEKLNPDYPKNLIQKTLDDLDNNKVVLIPLSQGTYNIFAELESENKLKDVNVIMIYPAKHDFNEFIKRYRKRGNSEIFMQYNHVTQFNEWVELFDKNKAFQIYYIKSDEYLEDVLKKLDIPLELK